jgi:RHO1 GDP-GTP exchange protein 1/2
LELNAFLTKPTMRLATYRQLLEAVLEHTPDQCSDKHDIPKVLTLIRELLAEVKREAVRTENRFNVLQLEQQIFFRPGEQVVRTSTNGKSSYYISINCCAPLGSAIEGGGP